MGGKTKILATLVIFATLASCRTIETKPWGECPDVDGFGLEADAVAWFDWSGWPDMITAIDEHHCLMSGATGYKWAKLRPGRHIVEYSNYVHDFGHVTGRIDMVLAAGHRYAFGFNTCYWCMPRRYAVWVADQSSGQVVWGRQPDWPGWFL